MCSQMASLTDLLAIGDLRSDGLANEVAGIVVENLELLPEVVRALSHPDPSVRGHGADALEKVARIHPDRLVSDLPRMITLSCTDPVPMVRWHMAMLLSHLSVVPATVPRIRPALLALLDDPGPFVRSWAITGLTIIARKKPAYVRSTARAIAPLVHDDSIAVATRARTALQMLENPALDLPRSWVKTGTLP